MNISSTLFLQIMEFVSQLCQTTFSRNTTLRGERVNLKRRGYHFREGAHSPHIRPLSLTGKGRGGKKGNASDETPAVKGAAGARRANVSELKGLVEVRASCQASRAGAGAVAGEGRPLLQVPTHPKRPVLSNSNLS